MGNLSYVPLTADLIEDLTGADITIETAVANYPSSELLTIPMGTTARGTDPGGGVRIKIDFGALVRPKFWALLNTDITSGNVVVYATNAAWAPTGETLIIPYRELDMKAYKPESWTPCQYFLLDFGACTFSQAFLEIGKLFAATEIVTFSKGFAPGVSRGEGNRNIHNVTPSGIEYTHLLQEKIGYLSINWDHLKDPLLNELLTFLRVTNGGGYPSIVIPDNDKSELFYVRNQDRTDWDEEAARSVIASMTLEFKELSRGKIQVG